MEAHSPLVDQTTDMTFIGWLTRLPMPLVMLSHPHTVQRIEKQAFLHNNDYAEVIEK